MSRAVGRMGLSGNLHVYKSETPTSRERVPDFDHEYRIERSSPIVPKWHQMERLPIGTDRWGAYKRLCEYRQDEEKTYPESPARFRITARPTGPWEVVCE